MNTHSQHRPCWEATSDNPEGHEAWATRSHAGARACGDRTYEVRILMVRVVRHALLLLSVGPVGEVLTLTAFARAAALVELTARSGHVLDPPIRRRKRPRVDQRDQ